MNSPPYKDCHKDWTLKALTDIWTGNAKRQGNPLIPTGIMGSLRWWCEVVVRGLGGKACDPTDRDVRCPDDKGRRCVVCELFGCTGWARKFRLMILDKRNNLLQEQIKKDTHFVLRFIPLRPVSEAEWCLVDITLRVIADWGAMGGKTTFKPSDERYREKLNHHRDFGLVELVKSPLGCSLSRRDIEEYLSFPRWRRDIPDSDFSWASLQNFWCVKGKHLARQSPSCSTFNRVLGRKEEKDRRQSQQLKDENDPISQWLAGKSGRSKEDNESKKIFSFKYPEEARRTFGFVCPPMVKLREIRKRLEELRKLTFPDRQENPWRDGFTLVTGEEILAQLLEKEEGGEQ